MFPEKIKLTDELIQLILDTRKKCDLTAYQLSEKIGKNKSWLPNIENRRTKNISKSDLYLLFKDFADKENLKPEQYIVKHLPRNCIIELEDGVTAPCYHVREMLGVYDSWEEREALSLEERDNELDFKINKRTYNLREKDVYAAIYRLSTTLQNKIQSLDLDDKEAITQYIDTMTDNIENDFSHTLHIYGMPYCPDDPILQESDSKTDYVMYLENLTEANETALYMMQSRAFVYSFIEKVPFDSYQFFENMENRNRFEDKEEDEKLYIALEDIKNFHFCIYEYIEYVTEYSNYFKEVPAIEYDLIFSKLYEAFRLYINVVKMNYDFDLPIPDCNSNIDNLHQQTYKIIFDIEKEMRSRYRNHNSLWSFSK